MAKASLSDWLILPNIWQNLVKLTSEHKPGHPIIGRRNYPLVKSLHGLKNVLFSIQLLSAEVRHSRFDILSFCLVLLPHPTILNSQTHTVNSYGMSPTLCLQSQEQGGHWHQLKALYKIFQTRRGFQMSLQISTAGYVTLLLCINTVFVHSHTYRLPRFL